MLCLGVFVQPRHRATSSVMKVDRSPILANRRTPVEHKLVIRVGVRPSGTPQTKSTEKLAAPRSLIAVVHDSAAGWPLKRTLRLHNSQLPRSVIGVAAETIEIFLGRLQGSPCIAGTLGGFDCVATSPCEIGIGPFERSFSARNRSLGSRRFIARGIGVLRLGGVAFAPLRCGRSLLGRLARRFRLGFGGVHLLFRRGDRGLGLIDLYRDSVVVLSRHFYGVHSTSDRCLLLCDPRIGCSRRFGRGNRLLRPANRFFGGLRRWSAADRDATARIYNAADILGHMSGRDRLRREYGTG